MAKSTIKLPDGTIITVDGNPEEIKKILYLYHPSQKEVVKVRKISKKRPKKKPKDIEPEEFNLNAKGNIPSLKDFLGEKKPKSVADHIAVIAYYITKLKKIKDTFTEGNIEYAYRVLKLKKRPKYLGQIIINKKNQDFWFESLESGEWKVKRNCDIYVEQNLPREKNRK